MARADTVVPLVLVGGVAALGLLALTAGGPVACTPEVRVIPRPGRWFSWNELTRSATARRLGLCNEPDAVEQTRLVALVRDLLDPLRARLGRPVHVTSAFRSADVNQAIPEAVPHSQHRLGEAADIWVEGLSSAELGRALLDSGLPFDQLIWYAPDRARHLHVSLTRRRPNRREVLHAPAGGGYVRGQLPPASAPRLT